MVHGTKYNVGNHRELGLYRTTGGSVDWEHGPRPYGAGIKYVKANFRRPQKFHWRYQM